MDLWRAPVSTWTLCRAEARDVDETESQNTSKNTNKHEIWWPKTNLWVLKRIQFQSGNTKTKEICLGRQFRVCSDGTIRPMCSTRAASRVEVGQQAATVSLTNWGFTFPLEIFKIKYKCYNEIQEYFVVQKQMSWVLPKPNVSTAKQL